MIVKIKFKKIWGGGLMNLSTIKKKKHLFFSLAAIFFIIMLFISYNFKQEIVEPFLILFVIISSINFGYKGAFYSLIASLLIIFIQDSFILDLKISDYIIEFTVIMIAGLVFVQYQRNLQKEHQRNLSIAEELKKSEEKYKSIFNNSPIGIYRSSSEGEIIIANPALANIMGCSSVEDLKNYYSDLASDLYYDSAKRDKFVDELKEQGEIDNFVFRARRKDGEIIWLQLSGQVHEYCGDSFTIDGFIKEITDSYEMEKKLAQSEEKFRSAFMNHNSPMLIINPDNMKIVEANQAALEFYGYSYDEITSLKINDINIFKDDKVKSEVENARKKKSNKFNFKHRLKSGEIRDVEVHSGPVRIDGQEYLFSIIHDITERKKVEEKINHMTFHDVLTDLYNRTYLEEELQRINTERQLPISIIMADLNNLKMINDRYGHARGDELLKKTADLLRDSCRHEDVIARQGGDEFVVVLPQTPIEAAEEIVDRIRENREDYKVGDEVTISIALGTASKNEVDEDIYDVLNRAEDRMYSDKMKTKSDGRRRALFSIINNLKKMSEPKFDPEILDDFIERLDIEEREWEEED